MGSRGDRYLLGLGHLLAVLTPASPYRVAVERARGQRGRVEFADRTIGLHRHIVEPELGALRHTYGDVSDSLRLDGGGRRRGGGVVLRSGWRHVAIGAIGPRIVRRTRVVVRIRV